jgi:hypothetical protein
MHLSCLSDHFSSPHFSFAGLSPVTSVLSLQDNEGVSQEVLDVIAGKLTMTRQIRSATVPAQEKTTYQREYLKISEHFEVDRQQRIQECRAIIGGMDRSEVVRMLLCLLCMLL